MYKTKPLLKQLSKVQDIFVFLLILGTYFIKGVHSKWHVAISWINFFYADMLSSDIQISSFVPLLQIVYLGFLNQYS